MKFTLLAFSVCIVVATVFTAPQKSSDFSGTFNASRGSKSVPTDMLASPPVDLSKPLVFLPDAIPIEEAPQELVAANSQPQSTKTAKLSALEEQDNDDYVWQSEESWK